MSVRGVAPLSLVSAGVEVLQVEEEGGRERQGWPGIRPVPASSARHPHLGFQCFAALGAAPRAA